MKNSIFNAVCKTRYLALLVVLMFANAHLWGEGTESFEGLSNATSYGSRSWTGTNNQSGWAATNARTDQKTAGSRGLTFKASTASTITMKLTSAQQSAGLGVLTFKYYYPFSDSGKSRQLSITIGGNTYSSGALSYTSSAKTATITVNQSLASATVTINVNNGGGRICVDEFSWTSNAPSCTAPNHVDIAGAWDRFAGETISLTATAYSSAGTGSPIPAGDITGYQWQKYYNSTWNDIAGATSATYTKSKCDNGDSGSYRCVVSTGATCSTASNGFQVKVYVLECYTGGTTIYNFTRIGDTQAGTCKITLAAGNHTFKFHADNDYYGNNGTINEDVSNWVCSTSQGNLTIAAGLGGTFTINMEYSTSGSSSVLGEPEISVTYPRKTIYFSPGVWNSGDAKFAFYYFRKVGETTYGNGWTGFITANDCGSSAEIPQWNGVKINAVRLNKNCSSPSWGDKWNQTSDITITSNNYVTITDWGSGDSPYTYGTYSVPTYTISYAKGSTTHTGGNAISGSKENETKTCGTAFTLPSSAVFTATGYTQTGWATSDGGSKAYNLGGSYTTNATQAFYPFWTVKTTTVSFNQTGGTGGQTTSKTATYGSAMPTPITCPTREGYDFGGYYDGTGGTGTKYYNADGTSAKNWDKEDASYTLHAKWTIKSYTINWYVGGSAEGNKLTTGSQTTNVNHGGKVTTLPTSSQTSIDCDDKTFVGWTNTTSYTHGTSLLFTDAAGSQPITEATNFYAVFAEGGNTEYVLTPAASLTAGEYVIAAYDDTNSKYLALTGAVSAASLGSNSDMVNETTGFTISEGKFTTLPTGACEFVLTAYTGETDNGFYIQNPADDKYLDYQTTTNRRLWFYDATDYVDEDDNPITPWAAWYGVALSKDGFPDNGMYLKYVDETYSLMSNGSGTTFVRGYANDNNKYKPIYLFKKTGGATGHTINCASCSNEVTVSYSDPGSGNTMAVTKGSTPIASGSTVKTCSAVDLTVTLTPAAHYSVTGLSAKIGSTDMVQSHSGNVYTVTIPQDATGTLTLTPTFTEDARVNITWNVNGVALTPEAAEGLTFVYSGGDITALPSTPSVPAGCSGTKEFVGWSEKNSGATEEDAAYYDDLFTTYAGAPTGITSDKTFYAVFATSAGDPLAGQTMWAEPWTGASSDKPDSPTSGATVYNSASITYAYTDGKSTTKLYSTGDMLSGGAAAPELLISKTSPAGTWTVTNIPTGGSAYTELTLSYKTNRTTIGVTSATSGITIGDASNEGNTYTRTITISHSPSTVNNFALTFTNNGGDNARIDDISVIVPGSASLTDYVTTCAASYTITYNKNTTDAVTNLPSPTSVLQSTGSGTLSDKVPTRATYTFKGWAETTNGAVAYAAGASITGVSADKTLYAVWQKTVVTEIELSKSSLDKYVGDPAVTLTVTSVLPAGADASVTWSSSNTTVATVNATGEVNFLAVGTANIIATSTVTGTTKATCAVTVWEKPTATFTDALHGLTTDENGVSLSSFNLEAEQGTPVVFPTLANQDKSAGTCEGEYYIFVGWTMSDNNDDPEDHLVTSHFLANGEAITYYAVWADAAGSTTYTKLTSNSFSTSAHYVIGAESEGTDYFLYSCEKTDANNSWGLVSSDPATDAPIQFTLSGTASALVATSTEATARYLNPASGKQFFGMSATSKTVVLGASGTIESTADTYNNLRYNSVGGLRWYTGTTTGDPAYFYEVTSGGDPHYRTSCCANKVDAPVVTATAVTSTSITLTWPADAKATGWEVSWNGGAFGAPSGTRTHTVSGLTPNTTYTWKVRATYSAPQCGADTRSGSTTTNQVYHVTYAKGDGEANCSAEGSTTDAMAYEAGATVTLQANGFTLSGHTFAGWTEDDEDVAISNNQFTMPEHDVVITASWTAKMDKYFDRMHDQTDSSHGGVAETEGTNEGKYYIAMTGCSYSAPTAVDSNTGDACQTTHYKLRGWIAASYVNAKGEITDESKIFSPGTTKTAGGYTYYAVWAEVTE